MTNAFFFFFFVKRNNKQHYHPIDWWSSSNEFLVLCVCECLAIEYKRKTLRPRLQSKINLRNSLGFWYRETYRSRFHLHAIEFGNIIRWIAMNIKYSTKWNRSHHSVCKRKSQQNPISKIDWSMAILSGHAINFHEQTRRSTSQNNTISLWPNEWLCCCDVVDVLKHLRRMFFPIHDGTT